ncbi:hypothetical protein ACP70R_035265 [Stipagrostis hirtigluma subsp. patula]
MDSPVPLMVISTSPPQEQQGQDTGAPMETEVWASPPPAPAPVQLAVGGALPEQLSQGTGAPMETQMLPPAVPVPVPPARRWAPRLRYKVEMIFREFSNRRAALIQALTKGTESLHLYGHADGKWEVKQPVELVPSDLPEPTLGINHVRDKMQRHKWLRNIAVDCNAWLISISFFIGAHLGANERDRLFTMINGLETVHEKLIDSDTYHRVRSQDNKIYGKDSKENDEAGVEDGSSSDDDETFCSFCGDRYHRNGFWICCDVCERWFHGKCVKIRAHEKEKIKHYECPECILENKGHDYKMDPLLSHWLKRY